MKLMLLSTHLTFTLTVSDGFPAIKLKIGNAIITVCSID